MNKKTRFISILLLCTLLLPQIGLFANADQMTTGDVTEKLEYYRQNVYKQDWYWDGGDIYTSYPNRVCRYSNCTCNVFYGASQCHGFALCLAYLVTGSAPRRTLASYVNGATSNGWTCYTRSALGLQGILAVGLQPGDIVRAARDSSYADGHTAVVWKIENGSVFFAECWGSRHCKLNWGGFNYYSYSLSDICSRYGYVAIWRKSDVVPGGASPACAHNYVDGWDSEHPHAAYRICTKCGDLFYTGEFKKLDDCDCCLGIHSWTYSYEDAHPHRQVRMCTVCGQREFTGQTADYVEGCADCAVRPYGLKIGTSEREISPGQSITLNAAAENADSFFVDVYRDGIKYATVDGSAFTDGSAVLTLPDLGVYGFTLTARKKTERTLTLDSALTVTLHVSDVTEGSGWTRVTYADRVPATLASSLCEERGGTLEEYSANAFTLLLPRNAEEGVVYAYSGYELYKGAFSRAEALAISEKLGGWLVSIGDAAENESVASLMTASGLQTAWIGLSDEISEGFWVWDDGTFPIYSNWSLAHSEEYDTVRNGALIFKSGEWCENPASSGSAGFIVEYGIRYTVSETGDGAVLTGNNIRSSTVAGGAVIPSKVGGKTVVGLAVGALDGMSLEYIVLPDTLLSIDPGAIPQGVEIYAPRDGSTASALNAIGAEWEIIIPFTDLVEGSWYYDSARFCYENGYLSGTSATTFSPSSNTTRAMLVTILASMSHADLSDYSGVSSFDDVELGKWYSAAVEWAYRNGITAGNGNNFGKSSPLTREQLAVFMRAYAAYDGESTDIENADALLAVYSDAGNISAWAQEAVAWAVERGLISGTSSDTVSPGSTATRAQISVIIMKYFAEKNGK